MSGDERKEVESIAERLERLEVRRQQEQEEAAAKAKASDGLFVRPRVVHREVFGTSAKVELIEFAEAAQCNGAPLVNGIPSSNMTSLLAAGYFAKQLELPTVACMRVHGASPQGIVKENVPGLQIRIVGNEKLVCLLAEQPVKGGGLTFNLVQALLSFCRRRSISHLFCVDGIPTPPEKMEDAETLRFCTSDAAFSKQMKEAGHVAMMSAILTGIAGQVLADATLAEGLEDMQVSAVLVKAEARLPSAHPSVHVVRALNQYFTQFDIDLNDLEDSAVEMEAAINKVVAEAKAKMSPSPRAAAPSSMYM